MSSKEMLDGNGAAAEALRLARVQVVAAYPIVPQSPLAEILAGFIQSGRLKARFIRVESEQAALSCALGAQLAGVRAGTATSSVALASLHELCGVAAGLRVPLVMPVVNRSLAAPWNFWCDHQDAMAERDSGWIQLYAANCQEVLDLLLVAYRAAEEPTVQLPVMVCLDGFFLSHTAEAVWLPDQDEVDEYLRPYQNLNLKLDPEALMFVNSICSIDEFSEMRYQGCVGFEEAQGALSRSLAVLNAAFDRSYGLVEGYRLDDAEAVIVGLGSMTGTMKYVVDNYRAQGRRVGLLRLLSYRPFPAEEVAAFLTPVEHIGVLDRSASPGNLSGPLAADVRAALNVHAPGRRVLAFVAGLGGRSVTIGTVARAFDFLLDGSGESGRTVWLDTDTAVALTLREAV